MLRKVSVRVAAVALAAGSLAMIPLSSPSSAATKVACTKLVGGKPVSHGAGSTAYITVKSLVSGCSASVGGKGTSITTIKGSNPPISKTTWAGGKGTSTQKVKYTDVTKTKGLGKCPAGSVSRLFITGTATAGTGAALKAIPKGSVGKSQVCLKKDSTSVLEPGTKSTF
jgi:hypothetical protein